MKLPFLRITQALKQVVAVLLFASVSLHLQAADLLEVYNQALSKDPTIEVARNALKAALEKNPQALAGLLPSISVNGADNVTSAQNEFSNATPVDRDVRAWNWSLQLTQPLIRMQNIYAYDEAERIVEQAKAQFNLAEQDMILRVVQAYFDVLSSQEGIKVGESELASSIEQLNLATKGYEKGIAAITDVRDSQARVDLARSHLVAAQSELDIKHAELGNIIDDVPEYLVPLNPAVKIPYPQPTNPRTWIDQARESHPAVHAAEFALLVAESRVSKSRAEHAPTLDFVASYNENYSSGSTTMPTDYSMRGKSKQAGIQFSMPLYSGGGTNSRVSEAIANKAMAGAQLEVARRQAATDARMAFSGLMNGLSQISASTSAVESNEIAVDANHKGYKLGIYNNVNVLNAEQNFYTAKRDLVKARYDTLIQALKLKAATGSLNIDELVYTNSLLEHPSK